MPNPPKADKSSRIVHAGYAPRVTLSVSKTGTPYQKLIYFGKNLKPL
jgi:hypothetical protein